MTDNTIISIEDVVAEWRAESAIDETQINVEVCRTPSLHSKYLNYFVQFKNELSKYESLYYRACNLKRKYYRGECTQEELKKYGWEQFQGLKPSLSEMNAYLEYDVELIKSREKIAELKTAVSSIEYILKSIASRDYSIKTLLDYNRYMNGG
jgi:hypothetical protein